MQAASQLGSAGSKAAWHPAEPAPPCAPSLSLDAACAHCDGEGAATSAVADVAADDGNDGADAGPCGPSTSMGTGLSLARLPALWFLWCPRRTGPAPAARATAAATANTDGE
eukprot:1151673-Pelagomonas_calceolata.AAC.8